jgi:hypothetical protein
MSVTPASYARTRRPLPRDTYWGWLTDHLGDVEELQMGRLRIRIGYRISGLSYSL